MITWRKSSHSGGGGSGGQECIEVAQLTNHIALRDSKAPQITPLTVTPGTFATLLTHLKHDTSDL